MLASLRYSRQRSLVSLRLLSQVSSLTEDQLEFKRVADDFARTELLPFSSEWDKKHFFPVDTLRALGSLGFGGLFVAEDVGGSSLSRSDGAVIFESLAYGDVPVTAYLSIHNMVCSVIDRWGTQDQRSEHLPQLTTLNNLAAYCLTEPGSGSDAASLSTVARKEKGGYRITGSKAFISGAGVADVYLVMARTTKGEASAHEPKKGISAFLVPKDARGLSFGKPEKKLGWHAQPTGAVLFEDVFVPEMSRIGQECDGLKIALGALDGGRVNIAACSVGGAQRAFDVARDYVSHRKQFGKSISDFQATQFKTADMVTDLEASRLLIRSAALALDRRPFEQQLATLGAAMAKRFATDACFNVVNTCLQLLGGYGYLEDYPIERILRDLRVHCILEGTNEIMRVIIDREYKALHPV